MKNLKLYLVEREDGAGYDEYEGFVVAEETEELATHTHPSGANLNWNQIKRQWVHTDGRPDFGGDWVCPEDLTCTLLGTAAPKTEPGVILSSFRAA